VSRSRHRAGRRRRLADTANAPAKATAAQAASLVGDVAEEQAVQELIAGSLARKAPSLDLLVNNADRAGAGPCPGDVGPAGALDPPPACKNVAR
jgi:NAD(P)-dependent dehydrogenase (short-subunit alcohol dehydrogenase family)